MDIRKVKAEMLANNPNLAFELKNDTAYQVGRQIMGARISAGKTQDDLAKELGTKQSAISRLERGASAPSLATLKRIANFCGRYIDIKLRSVSDLALNETNEPSFESLSRIYYRCNYTFARANPSRTNPYSAHTDDSAGNSFDSDSIRALVANLNYSSKI